MKDEMHHGLPHQCASDDTQPLLEGDVHDQADHERHEDKPLEQVVQNVCLVHLLYPVHHGRHAVEARQILLEPPSTGRAWGGSRGDWGDSCSIGPESLFAGREKVAGCRIGIRVVDREAESVG